MTSTLPNDLIGELRDLRRRLADLEGRRGLQRGAPRTETSTSYTLALTDARAGDIVFTGNAAITIPLDAATTFAVGTVMTVHAQNAAGLSVSHAGTYSGPTTCAQNEAIRLVKLAADAWIGSVQSSAPTTLAGDVTGPLGATVVGDDSHSHTATTLPNLAGDVTGPLNATILPTLGGDVSGTLGAMVVGDDSHSHTASTLPTDAYDWIRLGQWNETGMSSTWTSAAGSWTNMGAADSFALPSGWTSYDLTVWAHYEFTITSQDDYNFQTRLSLTGATGAATPLTDSNEFTGTRSSSHFTYTTETTGRTGTTTVNLQGDMVNVAGSSFSFVVVEKRLTYIAIRRS